MILVIAVVGLLVKWYRYDSVVANYGPNLGAAYKYFNILLALILVVATILFYVFVNKKPGIIYDNRKKWCVCAVVTAVTYGA